LCRKERPQLVITDFNMPGMDGLEALNEVWRERPVPAIVVSAQDAADLSGRVPPGRVGIFLQKPVSLTDLERAIDRITSPEGVGAEQAPPAS